VVFSQRTLKTEEDLKERALHSVFRDISNEEGDKCIDKSTFNVPLMRRDRARVEFKVGRAEAEAEDEIEEEEVRRS
jgi:hypothetical protein